MKKIKSQVVDKILSDNVNYFRIFFYNEQDFIL